MRRIGPTRGTVTLALTPEEWAEVYYALDSKANGLIIRKYDPSDPGTFVKTWAQQLRGIMSKIQKRVEV